MNLSETFNHYHTFVAKMDKGLKSIGPVTMCENPSWKPNSKKHRYHVKRESAFPGLSIYWARHTWATIASELDIPDATISAALGHSINNPTTAIYIDFNARKVDEANRKVIDYLLYSKV